eukprot:1431024-Rhodomonas_salina.1
MNLVVIRISIPRTGEFRGEDGVTERSVSSGRHVAEIAQGDHTNLPCFRVRTSPATAASAYSVSRSIRTEPCARCDAPGCVPPWSHHSCLGCVLVCRAVVSSDACTPDMSVTA